MSGIVTGRIGLHATVSTAATGLTLSQEINEHDNGAVRMLAGNERSDFEREAETVFAAWVLADGLVRLRRATQKTGARHAGSLAQLLGALPANDATAAMRTLRGLKGSPIVWQPVEGKRSLRWQSGWHMDGGIVFGDLEVTHKGFGILKDDLPDYLAAALPLVVVALHDRRGDDQVYTETLLRVAIGICKRYDDLASSGAPSPDYLVTDTVNEVFERMFG
jgi:hypothetical protein